MNIYLLEQYDNTGYDTYDSMVVYAESKDAVDVNAEVAVDISPVVNVTNTIGHKTEDVAVVAYHETANAVVDTANQAGHAINNAGNEVKHGIDKIKKWF